MLNRECHPRFNDTCLSVDLSCVKQSTIRSLGFNRLEFKRGPSAGQLTERNVGGPYAMHPVVRAPDL